MNWLDIIIVICLATGLIKGLFDGFVKQVVSFVALLAAFFFAGQIAIPVRNFLLRHIGENTLSPPLLSAFCYIIAFVCIILIIVLFGKIVDIAIKMTPAKPLNSLLGGLSGMLIWIISLSILFNILSVFDKTSMIIPKKTQEKSAFYYKVKAIVPTIYPRWEEIF